MSEKISEQTSGQKKSMRGRALVCVFLAVVIALLAVAGWQVWRVDPFFHYHKPDTDSWFYTLDNERSQNPGILKRFDYTGLILGTSETKGFKTTVAEKFFGGTFVKTPFSGAFYNETNKNLLMALEANPDIKVVIRPIDLIYALKGADQIRTDQGVLPEYLYDEDPFNDVEYLFNRDVIFSRVYTMMKDAAEKGKHGMTTFDDYRDYTDGNSFGKSGFTKKQLTVPVPGETGHLSKAEREELLKNIQNNITSSVEKYPDVEFYLFSSPYSMAWWGRQVDEGDLVRFAEVLEMVWDEVSKYPNARFFIFDERFDITGDLNNYKDHLHFGNWVNSWMLKCMSEGQYQQTDESMRDWLDRMPELYLSYDYSYLASQEDYEEDDYADALFQKEIYGVKPYKIGKKKLNEGTLSGATVSKNKDGEVELVCKGRLNVSKEREDPYFDIIMEKGFIGWHGIIEDIGPYKYLVFRGDKEKGDPKVAVYVIQNGEPVAKKVISENDVDGKEHLYVIDVSRLSGQAELIFHGGAANKSKNKNTTYIFRDIALY